MLVGATSSFKFLNLIFSFFSCTCYIHLTPGVPRSPSCSASPFYRRVAVRLPCTYRCMRPVATERVAWSVCLSVTAASCAKTAEPIDMPFGLRTWVGPRNNVGLLDGVQIPHRRGQFWGKRAHCIQGMPSMCGGDAAFCQITLTTSGCASDLNREHRDALGHLWVRFTWRSVLSSVFCSLLSLARLRFIA